jgi:hypothetical protein
VLNSSMNWNEASIHTTFNSSPESAPLVRNAAEEEIIRATFARISERFIERRLMIDTTEIKRDVELLCDRLGKAQDYL